MQSSTLAGFGQGGRCAIGGPVYHYKGDLKSEISFPEYFDNAWIIGDWMRNWVKSVHLDENYKVKTIDDLMPSQIFNKPVDMAFSPTDGALYLLEFGNTWGPNPEGRLVRIEYNGGNRKPVAKLSSDKESGAMPLTVMFSGKQSYDYDHDSLTYNWMIDGQNISDKTTNLVYSFKTPGLHTIKLVVSDNAGLTDTKELQVKAGNTSPDISFQLNNHSFYWDTLNYEFIVNDKEDGAPGKGISPDSVKVNLTYTPKLNGVKNNNGKLEFRGEVLLNENDCKSCHNMKQAALGPGFITVSERYREKANHDATIIDKLAHKVITGGTGSWGNLQMSAHPQLDMDKAVEIVKYILLLTNETAASKAVGIKGKINLDIKSKESKKGFYTLVASYTDKGSEFIGPLTGSTKEILRYSTLYPDDFDTYSDMKAEGNLLTGTNEAYVLVKQIDFSGVENAVIRASGKGGYIQLLIDSVKGEEVCRFRIDSEEKGIKEIKSSILKKTGKHDLYMRYVNTESRFTNINIEWISFK